MRGFRSCLGTSASVRIGRAYCMSVRGRWHSLVGCPRARYSGSDVGAVGTIYEVLQPVSCATRCATRWHRGQSSPRGEYIQSTLNYIMTTYLRLINTTTDRTLTLKHQYTTREAQREDSSELHLHRGRDRDRAPRPLAACGGRRSKTHARTGDHAARAQTSGR